MNKITCALILCSLLIGCNGKDDPDSSSSSSSSTSSSSGSSGSSSSGSSSSSSSSTSGSSSSSTSGSSSSSTSGSSSSSSSSSSGLSGSAALGKQVLLGGCAGCHSDAEEDGTFVGVFSFDVNQFTYHAMPKYEDLGYTGSSEQDLAGFIDAQMPNCVGECASNAAAYLWSLRGQTPQVEQFACDASAPLLYGRRDLKLLTSYEYHNSLQALFQVSLPDDFSTQNRANSDYRVGRMPNHAQEPVSEGRMTAYDLNAKELAEWAVSTDGALGFDCFDAVSCGNSFINEFAYYAFRRPLTFVERDEYRAMLEDAADIQKGLEWAIRSVLISPQFLYRSELGTKVSEAKSAVPDEPFADDVVQGDPITTISMPEISYDASGMGEYGAYEYVGSSPSYQWTGDDIIVVRVKSGGAGTGQFGITVNNGSFEHQEAVDSTNAKVLTLRVEGVTGSGHYMQTFNQSGNPISVSEITVGPAVMPEMPSEDIPNLDIADPDAYVLDAFEYAGALSYMFTGSSPDEELMQAAFAGELSDEVEVESQIDRMLDSELGRAHIGRLGGIWFRTDDVVNANRNGNDNFTQAVKDSMAQEIREMYKYVFYNEDVPFKALYQGDFTMLDSTLSSYYGVPGGGSSHMDFEYVDTSNTRRGGVIASGAFMTTNAAMDRSSPIFRSVHMRQDMLCQSIALPTNLNDAAAREEAGKVVDGLLEQGILSTADFYNMQTTVPGSSCATCHNAMINPLFAIDDFDNVGLPRNIVDGEVVQTGHGEHGQANIPIQQVNDGGYLYSGDVVGLLGSAEADRAKAAGDGLRFSGSKDLGQVMLSADLPGLDACLFEKTARFTLAHSLNPAFEETGVEEALDSVQKSHVACINDDMVRAYNANNGSPRAAMKALGLSDLIRYRR